MKHHSPWARKSTSSRFAPAGLQIQPPDRRIANPAGAKVILLWTRWLGPSVVIGLLVASCLLVPIVYAQDGVSFTASVNKTTLSLDDQLTLTLTVEGQMRSVPEPRLPSLEGFQVYSSGRSQQVSLVNGQFSASIAFNYILQPTRVGKHTIGSAEITLDSQTYRTQPIEVEVLEGRVPTPTPPEQAPAAGAPPQLAGQDLFVEAVVDKEEAYIGEQVTYTFRFYQGVDLFGADLRYNKPETTGFWTEDLPPQNQYYQTVAGRRYLVTEVKMGLFPTAVGTQTIGPASLRIEAFFSRQNLETDPLTVQALPLPREGQPADLSGAVGQYQVTAWLDKSQATVNEPVTLSFRVSGTGNVQTIPEPLWPELESFRSYEAKSTTSISIEDYRVQGEKTFEKLFIPREAGQYTIPSFRLSYFDSEARAYRTAETEPLALAVNPGAPEGSPVPPGTQQQAVTLVGRDIRHIKAAPPVLRDQGQHLYRNGLFLSSWALPPLLVIGAVLYQRQRQRLRQDVRYARLRRAHKMARRRLARAKQLMKGQDSKAFYGEVARAITGYLADKMNVPAAGLRLEEMTRELEHRGADQETVDRLNRCWEECDLGRFAPVAGTPEAMGNLLAEAQDFIVSLEGLKWAAK
jgi:hypothetical protein